MRNTTTAPLRDAGKFLTIQNGRDRLLFATALFLGVRCNELVKITWEDLLGEEISIFQSKTKKVRRMKIHPELKKIAKECHNGETGLAFTGRRGQDGSRPLTNAGVNHILRKYMQELGITTNASPSSHALRKTFGRNFYEANGKSADALAYLQRCFGHSNLATTLIYIGVDFEEMSERVCKIQY